MVKKCEKSTFLEYIFLNCIRGNMVLLKSSDFPGLYIHKIKSLECKYFVCSEVNENSMSYYIYSAENGDFFFQ